MEGSSSGYDTAVLTRQGSRGPRGFESLTFRRIPSPYPRATCERGAPVRTDGVLVAFAAGRDGVAAWLSPR